MKVLHIFPQFGPELVNGSDRHEYLLSRKLVELGVEVDVFTTLTNSVHQTSAFSSAWPQNYRERLEVVDGMRVERFPVSFSLSPRLGYVLSLSILKRWQREEQRYGSMVKGSHNLVHYYYRRAMDRPLVYDLMMAAARGPYSIRLLARLLKTARNYDAFLVGFTPYALMWQAIGVARSFRKPVVLLALFHPDDIYHHFRAIYWCYKRADAILAQTPYSLKLFRRQFPMSKPVAAGVGVDLREFENASVCGARFRDRYKLQDRKIVLCVGRKERFKRYDLALEAVELINDDRIQLVMIGRDVDGLPITSHRVTYLGELPRAEVLDAYAACDVLLCPSEYESFGWVLLEAWALRKPVIGNRFCAPVATVIQDGEDGFLCAGAAEIAERVAELAARPAMASRLGEAGYRKVAGRYTWDVIGQKVHEVYAQLAARNPDRKRPDHSDPC